MISHRSAHGNGATDGPGCGASPESAREQPGAQSDPNPLKPLLAQLAELREYIALYLATQADSVKLGLRRALIKAVLGIVGLVVALAIVTTAGVLLLLGMSNGISQLLGDRLWAGQLITATVVLTALAGGGYAAMHSLMKSSRKRTVEKYERRHHQERAAFGHDVRQRAGQPTG